MQNCDVWFEHRYFVSCGRAWRTRYECLVAFEDKFKSFCKFKAAYSTKQIGTTDSEVTIKNKDYASYIDENPDLKVDVIYTDFPYTDQVPYLERNQLYRVWLEKFYDSKYALTEEMLEKEIVQTNAESRTTKKI